MHKTMAWITRSLLLTLLVTGAGCGGGGDHAAGGVSTAALAAPAALVATGGINKVTLTWDPVPGATYYNIYWSADPGVGKATGTRITTLASPYEQQGLTVSQTYYYVVTAVNDAGESAASSQAATVVSSDGAALYQSYCANCHGPLTSTSIKDGMPDNIRAAIAADRGGMAWLGNLLTSEQIDLIAERLPCH